MWNPQLEQHLQNFDQSEDEEEEKENKESLVESSSPPTKRLNDCESDAPCSLSTSGSTLNQVRQPTCFSRDQTKLWPTSTILSLLMTLIISLSLTFFGDIIVYDGLVSMKLSSSIVMLVLARSTFFEYQMLHKIFNDSANQQYSQADPRQQQQQSLDRTRISALLGSIGAPPLSSLDSSKALSLPSYPSDANETLQTFVSQHSIFLTTVHEALQVLQTATRMQLGLGWKLPQTGAVDRVERAAVGRLIRCHPQAAKARFPLSLSTLRNQMWTLLDRQCRSLGRLLKNEDKGYEQLSLERERDAGTENPITLTILRSKKSELVELVGRLSNIFLSGGSTTARDWNALKQTTKTAIESNDYLENCMSTQRPVEKNFNKLSPRNRAMLENVDDLLEQSSGFEIAAFALRDVLQQDKKLQPCTNDELHCEWWHRVTSLVTQLNSKVQEINQEFYSNQNKEVEPPSQQHDASNDQTDQTSERDNGDGDYVINGKDVKNCTPAVKSSSEQPDNKTFVFLVGSSDPSHDKYSGRDASNVCEDGMEPDELLLHELRNRLSALPPAEEVTVTQHHDKEIIDSKTTVKSELMSCSSETAIDFQGELTASLANFTMGNDEAEDESINFG